MARRPAAAPPPRRSGPPLGLIGAVTVLVIALIAALVYLGSRGEDLGAGGSANALPDGGGIAVSSAEGVPQVHVYEDFQCPWCGVLERSVGEELVSLAEAGDIGLTFTLMSFLDSNLGNDASHRATNAALCADDRGVFTEFHQTVYANQPEREGTGWTDEELLDFGREAGLDGEAFDTFSQCVQDDTYGDYVEDMQQRANRDDVSGTPTVRVDGEDIGNEDMNRLMSEPGALAEVLEGQG